MIIKTSMSGLGRIDKCLPSVILPKTFSAPSSDATRGQAIHRYLKLVPDVGRDAALGLIDEEYRETCEVIDLERLPLNSNEWAAEVAWAYNWKTGTAREIGRGLDRAYEELINEAEEIPGAADVTGLTPTHAIILDYKSGYADQGPPANSWQLLTYALAAARAYDRTAAFVGFVRLRPDGTPWFDVVEVGEIDLDAHEEKIRALMERVQVSLVFNQEPALRADTHEGGWCKLCPAFHSCPAKVSLAAALARPESALDLPVLNEENLPAVLARLDAVAEVVKRIRASVREYGLYRAIPMGDGKVFGAIQVVSESVDAEKGYPVMVEKFGQAVADVALKVERSMPWTTIDKAMRLHMKAHPGTKIGAMNAAAEQYLRAAGALKESSRTDVKIFRPKQLKEGK